MLRKLSKGDFFSNYFVQAEGTVLTLLLLCAKHFRAGPVITPLQTHPLHTEIQRKASLKVTLQS